MEKLDERLMRDIEQYCGLNGLDIESYVNRLLRRAFMVDKYGERPRPLASVGKKIEEKADEKSVEYTFNVKIEEETEKDKPSNIEIDEKQIDNVKKEEKPKKRKLESK